MTRKPFGVRSLLTALVVAFSTPGPATAQSSDAQHLEQLGLLGQWAVDCARPPGPDNPHQIYSVNPQGQGEIGLRFAPGEAMSVARIMNPRLLSPGILAYTYGYERGAGEKVDLVISITDGVKQTQSSRSQQGQEVIRDGKLTATGKPSTIMRRCSATPS